MSGDALGTGTQRAPLLQRQRQGTDGGPPQLRGVAVTGAPG